MRLFTFNFSHEMAMAAATANYCPTLHVRQMEHELAPLAVHLAAAGDGVAVAPDMVERYRSFYEKSHPDVQIYAANALPAEAELTPWGLNHTVCARMKRGGLRTLPSAEQCDEVAELSSRRHAATLLARLHDELPECPLSGDAEYADSRETFIKAVGRRHGRVIMKAPISGAGRGLHVGDFGHGTQGAPTAMAWAESVIRKQGGVVVETFYDRRGDFACEFEADATGRVRYVGLSLFATNANGAYAGNHLYADDKALLAALTRDVGAAAAEALEQVIARLEQCLGEMIGGRYTGPLGVDMMWTAHADGCVRLHPCVEINLRLTMGHVALTLSRQMAQHSGAFAHDDWDACERAFFAIRYAADSKALTQELTTDSLLLTPVYDDTHFVAVVTR